MLTATQEFAKIVTALELAVADIEPRLRDQGLGLTFNELVKHAREMHVLLKELMHEEPSLVTMQVHGYCDTVDERIRLLEETRGRAGKKLQ